MKDQFVTYEIALKLKELGFDEECFGYWRDENKPCPITMCKFTTKYDFDDNINFPKFKCLAPLWQQVIDWFRVKYLIDIDNGWCISNPLGKKQEGYNISVYDRTRDEFAVRDFHIDYYKAREQAILKAIKLCQNKN